MNFSPLDLLTIRNLCLSNYDHERLSDFDYALLNLVDRIEKELGIENNPIDIECDGCNAEAGEPCRESCTGKAEWDENGEDLENGV